MTETLLINFLILLFPVLIYLVFFENRITFYNKKLFILLAALTIILCMSYPIRLELGFIFDLRYIPFIIALLYGGYKVGFPLVLVIIGYRLIIGGNGTVNSIILSTVIFILVSLLHKKFLKLNSANKIWCAAMINFVNMVIYLSILTIYYETLNKEFWIISINALTIYVVCTVFIMILVEKIYHNIKNREKLIHLEQFNIINELSASVAHEIRNPLTVTSGFLQLLNESKSMSKDEKWYIDLSLKELNRAEEIVSDFLTFGKPQSENMVYSNFKDETEYVKNVITPYANLHKVTLQLSFSNTLFKKYDKSQFQQCLLNLYKNGIEAMKDNGGILSIDVSDEGEKIRIKITDTGIGMTEKEILRIGKPYYSTKATGTGLGLLMVYSTINIVGGKIDIKSEKGRGSTFLITIPVK